MRGKTCYIVSFKNLTIQIVFKKMCVQFLKLTHIFRKSWKQQIFVVKDLIIYLIIKGFIWGIAFRGEGELMISDQLGLCENKCLWYF